MIIGITSRSIAIVLNGSPERRSVIRETVISSTHETGRQAAKGIR